MRCSSLLQISQLVSKRVEFRCRTSASAYAVILITSHMWLFKLLQLKSLKFIASVLPVLNT